MPTLFTRTHGARPRRCPARLRAGHHAGRASRARPVGRRAPRGPRPGREVTMAESVLVVDDDPDVARFVEVNLRSAGYEVTVASDGQQAVDAAVDLRPDLVLLDVMMPKLD